MSALMTEVELDFGSSQGLSPHDFFDGTGMSIGKCRPLMKRYGFDFVFNAGKCREGHRLQSRSGHCIQCKTTNIVFQTRYSKPGFLYVAVSNTLALTKIGTTENIQNREKSLRTSGYGGALDWVIRAYVWVDKAGRKECNLHRALSLKRAPGSYAREGRTQDCQELFRCSLTQALSAVKSALPEGTLITRLSGP